MSRRYYSSTAAATTLVGSIAAGDTSITVASVAGHPTSFPYTLVLDPDTASEEVVSVTSGSGTTRTITRGQDGTVAVSHTAGASVVHGVSARDFDEPNAHIAASSGVHGLAGTVVGTSDTQTLTNKTLTAPVITGSSGSVVTTTATQTLTNKTLTSPTLTSPSGVPWGKVGYAENLVGVGGIVALTDIVSVTFTAVAGRRYKVSAHAFCAATGAGNSVGAQINEGGTRLVAGGQYLAVAGVGYGVDISVVLTPSAGSHTYTLKIAQTGGAGTVSANAAADAPTFILVEDIGV